MTYEELSHFTWGDLSSLTWGDLEQPINVLYERYRDSQLPLTVNTAEQMERLIHKLPEDLKPVTMPETVGDSISLLKRIQGSHVFQTAVDAGIVALVTKLIEYLIHCLHH